MNFRDWTKECWMILNNQKFLRLIVKRSLRPRHEINLRNYLIQQSKFVNKYWDMSQRIDCKSWNGVGANLKGNLW